VRANHASEFKSESESPTSDRDRDCERIPPFSGGVRADTRPIGR
jgi:hypothetical protein